MLIVSILDKVFRLLGRANSDQHHWSNWALLKKDSTLYLGTIPQELSHVCPPFQMASLKCDQLNFTSRIASFKHDQNYIINHSRTKYTIVKNALPVYFSKYTTLYIL